MKFLRFAAFAIFLSPASASANEIEETLATEVRATLTSPQSPADLEVCVAGAITKIGGAVPVPLRNGPDNVMMLGYGHTPKLIILLDKVEGGTKIRVYTGSGDMDGKLVSGLLETCVGLTVVR